MERIPPNLIESERLEKALGLLAALVAKDTAFLPFFQKIEMELNLAHESAAALDRARTIWRSLAKGPDANLFEKARANPAPRSPGPANLLRRQTKTG